MLVPARESRVGDVPMFVSAVKAADTIIVMVASSSSRMIRVRSVRTDGRSRLGNQAYLGADLMLWSGYMMMDGELSPPGWTPARRERDRSIYSGRPLRWFLPAGTR